MPTWIAEGKRLEELTTEDTESTEGEWVVVLLEAEIKKVGFCELRFIIGIGDCKPAKIHRFFVKKCQIASCEFFRRKLPLFILRALRVLRG